MVPRGFQREMHADAPSGRQNVLVHKARMWVRRLLFEQGQLFRPLTVSGHALGGGFDPYLACRKGRVQPEHTGSRDLTQILCKWG